MEFPKSQNDEICRLKQLQFKATTSKDESHTCPLTASLYADIFTETSPGGLSGTASKFDRGTVAHGFCLCPFPEHLKSTLIHSKKLDVHPHPFDLLAQFFSLTPGLPSQSLVNFKIAGDFGGWLHTNSCSPKSRQGEMWGSGLANSNR